MATKKITFKDTEQKELIKLLGEKREHLRTLRFTAAGARNKNAQEPRNVRKEIARILTELGSRTKVAA